MHTTKLPRSKASTKEKVAVIVGWLEDKKAKSIVAFDLARENSLAEAIIIASSTSARHAQGLAEHVLRSAREEGYEFLRMEGNIVGQWILLDLNDVIVHIFQPDARELFRLEDLWTGMPVLADTRKAKS